VERVVQVACPLWRGLGELEQALDTVSAELGDAPAHAVTMTGEMVDLFATREDGVAALVEIMLKRFPHARFWAGEAGFVGGADAAHAGLELASANWIASAALVAARLPDALFVDVGSTTTDLVPIRSGRIRARGRDDAGRLEARELVYSGVVRTPVLALAEEVPFEGRSVPLIAELFATTADVHRVCGTLPAHADCHPAADGGEKTVTGSARRLARMIGRDAKTRPLDAWRQLAAWLAEAQLRRIEAAATIVLAREPLPSAAPLVAAGVGRFLVDRLAMRLDRTSLDFAELIPLSAETAAEAADCAPAVAVALLSRARGDAGPPSD
jgi:(4-(4-[2-(gamma-L-glutamylamino)ethyl]phenoxymethyl)furan-2-yl)methanamine synthase